MHTRNKGYDSQEIVSLIATSILDTFLTLWIPLSSPVSDKVPIFFITCHP